MHRIKFYGIGGQGAVTAAKVLSQAVSIYQNEYAITVPAYGHERRGAPVFAHIIVDDKPVSLNCYVYEPDIVVVFDETIMDKHVNVGEGCHDGTILLPDYLLERRHRQRPEKPRPVHPQQRDAGRTGQDGCCEHRRDRKRYKGQFWKGGREKCQSRKRHL